MSLFSPFLPQKQAFLNKQLPRLTPKQISLLLNLSLQKTLAENVRAFETSKESEKKKLEEERKWVRREKNLFEKSQKDKKTNFERRAQDEVEELQNKVRGKKMCRVIYVVGCRLDPVIILG